VVSVVSLLVVTALNVERFVTFNRTFQNLTNVTGEMLACGEWFCTADFALTLCVTLNLGQ